MGENVDFPRIIELLGGYLESRAIRWAVCGGHAMAAYGLVRVTFDTDLVVDGDGSGDVVSFLERQGFETLFRSRGFSNHLHSDPELGRVDLVYVRDETREKLFAAAEVASLAGGLSFRVPSPEHLAAMKVAALKSDTTRLFQDLADIRYLLTVPGVDREEVRGYFVRHGLESRFEELAASL